MALSFGGGWGRIKGLFNWGGIVNSDRGEQYSGPQTRSNDAQIVYTDERAMQVSSVWSCARLITETVGSLPLGVFEKTAEGRDENTSHYLHRLFRESPNALMTCLEFREAMTLSIVLWGNAYAAITWDGTPLESEVLSLMPLRVDCMLPRRLGQTVTYHY